MKSKLKELFWIDVKNGKISISLFLVIIISVLTLSIIGISYQQNHRKEIEKNSCY